LDENNPIEVSFPIETSEYFHSMNPDVLVKLTVIDKNNHGETNIVGKYVFIIEAQSYFNPNIAMRFHQLYFKNYSEIDKISNICSTPICSIFNFGDPKNNYIDIKSVLYSTPDIISAVNSYESDYNRLLFDDVNNSSLIIKVIDIKNLPNDIDDIPGNNQIQLFFFSINRRLKGLAEEDISQIVTKLKQIYDENKDKPYRDILNIFIRIYKFYYEKEFEIISLQLREHIKLSEVHNMFVSAADALADKVSLSLTNTHIIENLEARFEKVNQKIKNRILSLSDFNLSRSLFRFSAVSSSLDEFVDKLDSMTNPPKSS
jgi:hypothetical protein